MVLGLLLFIPGRLPALFWGEFYEGQRRMQSGDYEQAASSFEAFLSKIRSRPWLKRLIYFRWGVHTWDIEAMTLNNLGNTFVERGQPSRAAQWYEAALKVDPHYGVAYSNLAIVRYAEGDDAEAEMLLDRAHALGNRHLTPLAAQERAAVLRSIQGAGR